MKKVLFLSAGLALCFSMPAFAQVSPDLQRTDPGAVDSYRFEKIREKRKNIKEKKEEDDDPAIEGLIEEKEKQKEIKAPEFTLNKINFEGNTVIKEEKLQEVVKPYIGETITVNDLLKITKKVTNVYQQQGYLTSMAYLPPQKIEGGVAKIEILEGKIGKIDIKGNKWYKTRYLKKNILKSNDLEEDKVLNVRTLRASLQEINNQESLKGRAVIEESEDPEYVELILDLEDRIPLDFGITWDNQGRELIGKQRALLSLSYDNITGYGDRLYSGVALADGTFGINNGYSIPIGTEGTKISFDHSYSNVNIEGTDDIDLKNADINGFSNYYSISVTHPFIKKYDKKLYGQIGFDMRDARTYQKNPSSLLSKYNTRVLRTGLYGVKDDSRGRWVANSTVSTGLPIFGARIRTFDSGESHRAVGTNKFIKMETGLTRYQVLPFNSLGILRLAGQWANRRLLAAEQMQLGGIGTVRGYEEGFILGDWGFVSSVELRTPIPFFRKILPEKLKFIHDRVKWANFFDAGYVDELHRSKATYTNLLCGVGSGLNINILRSLDFNIYLGIPVAGQKNHSNNVTYDSRDLRIHFNLTSDVY